jgi:hypothetical protein
MTQPLNVFEQALAERKALEEEVEQKKNYVPGDFDDIEYCALEVGVEKVIRPIGEPFSPQTLTSKKDTDIKILMHSEIEKDDKLHYSKIHWPCITKTTRVGVKIVPDPDWILTRLYNKVVEKQWIDYEDGHKNERGNTGEYHYLHEDTTIYKQIKANGAQGKYKNFYPSVAVFMNVIDRTDDWCEKNKHTKILISNMGKGDPKRNEVTGEVSIPLYPSKGVTRTVYDAIFNKALQLKGFTTDFVIKKIAEKKGDKNEYKYSVFDATELRVQTGDISESSLKISKISGIGDDWDLYNTVNLSKQSSYFKLKRDHGKLFQMFDATFPNEPLSSELDECVKLEAEEYKKNNVKNIDESLEQQKKEQVKEMTKSSEVQSDVKKEEPAKRERKAVEAAKSIAELCAENFKSWTKVDVKEQQILIDLISGFDGGTPLWKPEFNGKKADLGPCTETNCTYKGTSVTTNFPLAVHNCPNCGALYSDAD